MLKEINNDKIVDKTDKMNVKGNRGKGSLKKKIIRKYMRLCGVYKNMVSHRQGWGEEYE